MNQVKLIKNHKLLHGDITKGSIDNLMNGEKFDILYADPPWGIGPLKMFNTLNAKMNGVEKEEVSWEVFIDAFCDMINKFSKDSSVVIIEMGLKHSDHVKNFIESKTKFRVRQIFNARYKSNKLLPLHILYFSLDNPLHFNESTITDTYGEDCTDKIIQQCAFKDAIILDPCCGFGRTLRMAHKYDMLFRGNEINQKRLDKAIKYAETKI
jgi:DNA modification methylase